MDTTRVRVAIGSLLLLTCLASPASAANFEADEPSTAAMTYASTQLKGIVQEILADEAEDYGFTSPLGTITVGSLKSVYHPSKDFTSGQLTTTLAEKLTFSKEWVAVVYQDGLPINVVGMWEPEPDVYEMTTFGYGRRPAEAIHNMTSLNKLMYEGPIDAWYEVNQTTVTPRSGVLEQSTIGVPMSWEAYYLELSSRDLAIVNDGALTTTTTTTTQGGTPPPESLSAWFARTAPSWGIPVTFGAVGMFFGVTLLRRRQRERALRAQKVQGVSV